MKRRLAVLLGLTLACGMLVPLTTAPPTFAAECLVTGDEFTNAVSSNGYPRPTQAQYAGMCAQLSVGNVTSRENLAQFLAHAIHESDGLRTKREYACEQTGCPGSYETPGTDVPGQRYYGRGYFQLAWSLNYQAASRDLYGDDRLVQDPDMVARDEAVAWGTALWFWKTNVTAKPGYGDAFGWTTKAMNGPLECDNPSGHAAARHRYAMYGKVRAALGLPGPGNEQGCYN